MDHHTKELNLVIPNTVETTPCVVLRRAYLQRHEGHKALCTGPGMRLQHFGTSLQNTLDIMDILGVFVTMWQIKKLLGRFCLHARGGGGGASEC